LFFPTFFQANPQAYIVGRKALVKQLTACFNI